MNRKINSVIIGRRWTTATLRDRSHSQPDTLFISVEPSRAARNGMVVETRASAVRLLLWLCCANERIVSVDELVDLIYGGAVDGGPEGANGIVRLTIIDAKLIGAALGILVAASGGRGYYAKVVELVQETAAA